MALGQSIVRRSQAARGYLNLRRFVLVGSFFIVGAGNDSEELDDFKVALVCHTE